MSSTPFAAGTPAATASIQAGSSESSSDCKSAGLPVGMCMGTLLRKILADMVQLSWQTRER